MLRVLMLSTDLERGGYPLRLVRLADELRTHEVEPIVGSLAPRGPLHTELETRGIETFACDARVPWDAGCILRLAHVVRRANPDLIHASLLHANLAARLIGRLGPGKPLITGSVTVEIERSWHRLAEVLTCGWSDVHVANSSAVAEHLVSELGFPREKVRVIRNGLPIDEIERTTPVDRRRFGLAVDCPLLVWAGRMDRVKNLPMLLEVVAAVRAGRRVQALLLGDGPERPRVEARVRERHLDGVVIVAAWSDDVCGWLKASDLLVFPSRTEGSPNVVLEAMASGCPVVASDIPACRELIEHGEHGWLCPAGDATAFGQLICSALSDTAARERVAKAARQRVQERHDIRQAARQWRSLYDQVLNRGMAE